MKLKICLLALFTFIWVGCSSESPTTFIPSFNATWPVEGDEDYEIDLQPTEDNKNVHSGVFEGSELHQDDQDPRFNNFLSGSFDGLDIEFTIERENGDKIKYAGKMTPISETNHFIVKIELHSSEGNIVLSR